MGAATGPVVIDGLLWQANHLVLPWMSKRIPEMVGLAFGNATFPATGMH